MSDGVPPVIRAAVAARAAREALQVFHVRHRSTLTAPRETEHCLEELQLFKTAWYLNVDACACEHVLTARVRELPLPR